jgi:hypothetical protein
MNKGISTGLKEREVANILRKGMPKYSEQFGPLPGKTSKVVHALQVCRTEALGAHSYKCDSCEYEKHAFNSCRDRHCPKCQGFARIKWVQNRLDELLPVGYFHVVFTVPSELNPFALRNKKAFYDILQRSVADTLLELAADPKYLGAETGFISVLHTWGQNMMDHPHIHCIVPRGGIKKGKKWIKGKGEFLFPFKVMSRLFKGKFMSAFKKGIKAGDIRFHGSLKQYADYSLWQQLVNRVYEKEWVVYCKPPFANEKQVIKYLGGYTHRIAISNHRILNVTDETVTFKWKSYADNNQVKNMTLSLTEFIRRFLMHVLPNGYKRIRYYGFLANRKRKKSLDLCFSLLGKAQKQAQSLCEKTVITDLIKSLFNLDITLCPKCGQGHLQPVFSGVRYTGGVF